MNKEIHIPDSGAFRISASAGSGKTHNLTRVFLKRMLRDKNSFRGMLAITFTNKAANELRERILFRLKELSDVASDCSETDFFGFPDRQQLAVRAAEVLEAVVHNPEWLQVGTIDSFFQQVFATLALETGLPAGLKTELDVNRVKTEMLEEVLAHRNADLLKILIENLSNQLYMTGKDWRPAAYIHRKVLDVVFEEPVISLFMQNQKELLQDERLNAARIALQEYLQNIRNEVKLAASAILDSLSNIGILPENLDADADRKFIAEMQRIIQAAEDGEVPEIMKSYSGKGTFHNKIVSMPLQPAHYEILSPLLMQYAAVANSRIAANYSLAENLLWHVASIRLLVYMREVLQQQNQEQNRYLLTEVKYLLASFLETSDIPYLFEKTGSRLHTLLIDEFQDTDRVQWRVLKALAEVVMENDGLFSVVGDVKQSIYSWRGADSSLFRQGLNEDLSRFRLREASLESNYRSLPGLVAFNNWLFSTLPEDFSGHLAAAGHLTTPLIWQKVFRENYRDVQQLPSDKNSQKGSGFVDVRVRPKPGSGSGEDDTGAGDDPGEETVSYLHWLPEEIMRLQNAGIRASDIAILVRKNSDVTEAIRVLDQAARTQPAGFDFTFNTGANTRAGNQPLFLFLVQAMRLSLRKDLRNFEFEQMRCLAAELKLEPEFQVQGWEKTWSEFGFSAREPDGAFHEQASYFRLGNKEHLQSSLLSFQELLHTYLREDSIQYPDFFQWWTRKASEIQVPLGSGGGGITIMTIHRSKGLDFGVVILPLFSTAQGDSRAMHDAFFWARGSENPWNSHPLLRGKASKKLLESDLGELYGEDVFRRAAEMLNTLYVACTRARFGLVLDITSDGNLEKQEKAAYRLPFQTAALLYNQREVLPFSAYNYQMNIGSDGLMLHFSMGTFQNPEKPDSNKIAGAKARQSDFYLSGELHGIPSLRFEGDSAEARIGKLVHKVLENTGELLSLEEALFREKQSGNWHQSELKEAEVLLNNCFELAELQDWFSGTWVRSPEAEMYDDSGKVCRADLILGNGKQSLVVDFKTGMPMDEHKVQIRHYMKVFQRASGQNPEGRLVYLSPAEIIEVN